MKLAGLMVMGGMLGLGTGTAYSGASPVEGPDAAFWQALRGMDHGTCAVLCLMDDCSGDNEHYAVTDYDIDEYDGGPHSSANCADQQCDWVDPGNGKHPRCGVSEEQDEEDILVLTQAFHMMDSAVRAGELSTIQDLIAAAPLKFRVDTAREVLQLTACGERVVAQYAIAPQDLRLLSSTWSVAMQQP